MARFNLSMSMKFKKLVRRIALAPPFVRGLLETLWDSAHAKRDPLIGDADEVEIASDWPGAPGAWFESLRDCGWIDQVDESWQLHDYWEHAPTFVLKRCAESAGMTYSEFRNGKLRNNSENKSSGTVPLSNPIKPNQTQSNPLPPNPPGGEGFDDFWTEYPKKRSKAAARRSWKRLRPNAELRANILAAVKRQITSPEWRKDNGQFIPYPASWLNAGAWEDVVANVNATSDCRKAATAETLKRTTLSDEEIAAGRARLLQLKNKVAESTEVPL